MSAPPTHPPQGSPPQLEPSAPYAQPGTGYPAHQPQPAGYGPYGGGVAQPNQQPPPPEKKGIDTEYVIKGAKLGHEAVKEFNKYETNQATQNQIDPTSLQNNNPLSGTGLDPTGLSSNLPTGGIGDWFKTYFPCCR